MMDIFGFLPEVIKSDTSKTIFNNLFDRFFSKHEAEHDSGYIGIGNPKSKFKRNILESDVHQQAYQLQPVVYKKDGDVDNIMSWVDILDKLEHAGITKEQVESWIKLYESNWAPPIDLDKLINYSDYFWVPDNSKYSDPQYITIRNRCATAQSKVNYFNSLIQTYGESFNIVGLTSDHQNNNEYPVFDVVGQDVLVISGNITDIVSVNEYIRVFNQFNDHGFIKLLNVTYDSQLNRTHLKIDFNLQNQSTLNLRIESADHNIIVIDSDLSKLFLNGFIFFISGSMNPELDSVYFETLSSDYDKSSKTTKIKVNKIFTNGLISGNISLSEVRTSSIADMLCQCDESIGWDIGGWSDTNIENLTSVIQNISHSGPPQTTSSTNNLDLWFDVVSDILYQYDGTSSSWITMRRDFSKLAKNISGEIRWDYSEACGTSSVVGSSEQWVKQNRWVHRLDVIDSTNAKQAKMPIIEYQWDLGLNEWTKTNLKWIYRADIHSDFVDSKLEPSLIELIKLENFTVTSNRIILDWHYGDMTDYFTDGRIFMYDGSNAEILTTAYSRYIKYPQSNRYVTEITLTSNVPASIVGNNIIPVKTIAGDHWSGYGIHWVFGGEINTTPISTQLYNEYIEQYDAAVYSDQFGDYNYMISEYSQDCTILRAKTSQQSGVSTIILHQTLNSKALIGTGDARVYVNGDRIFGIYDELSEFELTGTGDDTYVSAIRFFNGYDRNIYDNVRIDVGESSFHDIGLSAVPVRMTTDDSEYQQVGNVVVSLNKYRKVEQIKTETQQYPLFDMFNPDGTSSGTVSPIFSYAIDHNAKVNSDIGMRVSTTEYANDYKFINHLFKDDKSLCYFDFSNIKHNARVNLSTNTVWFWVGGQWRDRIDCGGVYMSAIISNTQPVLPWFHEANYSGIYWFDTLNGTLMRLVSSLIGEWESVECHISNGDYSLQSIWRTGLNDETYNISIRDWVRRTEAEYNMEMESYIDSETNKLILSGDARSLAETKALKSWYDSQRIKSSPDGVWIGDYEIPKPMIYNPNNDDRSGITYRQLYTHFKSIIDNQENIPGYSGLKSHMFHLITSNSVNYGVGGTIKHYGGGFDLFISSIFSDFVNHIDLIDFAYQQTSSMLNSIKSNIIDNFVQLMTDTNVATFYNQGDYISSKIIEMHDNNDIFKEIYGDSTTYDTTTGVGMKNWIISPAYIGTISPVRPFKSVDNVGRQLLVHHDGHRSVQNISKDIIDSLYSDLISLGDDRTKQSQHSTPLDTFGRQSVNLPPNTIEEFEIKFNTSILNRSGVYWYRVSGDIKELYRLNINHIGETYPPSSIPIGGLWLDMTKDFEVLRVKEIDPKSGEPVWNIVDGLSLQDVQTRLHNGTDPYDMNTSTVSAWTVVNINEIINDVLYNVETRLYDNVYTEPTQIRYDISNTVSRNSATFNAHLEDAFARYSDSLNISDRFSGNYNTTDPFTWNYKRSQPAIYPSQITSNNPNNKNTGMESGGCWRDLYNKIYGTPYPNEEPWKLQGYNTKPDWWESSYANLDVRKWGKRRWAYKHGFKVISVDQNPSENSIKISGDFRDFFTRNRQLPFKEITNIFNIRDFIQIQSIFIGGLAGESYFVVSGDMTNTFTDNIRLSIVSGSDIQHLSVYNSVFSGPPNNNTKVYVNEVISNLSFTHVNGSLYNYDDNLTTLYISQPISGLLSQSYTIELAYGMWENIRVGVIPAGRRYPNGVTSVTGNPSVDVAYNPQAIQLPKYIFFSVNVLNSDIVIGQNTIVPDGLLPPYWDYSYYFGSTVVSGIDYRVRTLFNTISSIITPGSKYKFGDIGETEFDWRLSLRYQYDVLQICFKLDPVNFNYNLFGYDKYTVSGVDFDSQTGRLFRHSDIRFHGDMFDNETVKYNGLNQWYVNYSRYSNVDIGSSGIREQWRSWEMRLSYQFTSLIDTNSLNISHSSVGLTGSDYKLIMKKSKAIDEYWINSFIIDVLSIPPKISRYDNDIDWEFEFKSVNGVINSVQYYDIKNYEFYADIQQNKMILYTWEPIGVTDDGTSIILSGDKTLIIKSGMKFNMVNSSNPDTTYTVESVTYNSFLDNTYISVVGTTFNTLTFSGLFKLKYRTLPWSTGDKVILDTTEYLPYPLQVDIDGVPYEHFIIILNDSEFRIARSYADAINSNPIQLTNDGKGVHHVGEIASVFAVDGVNKYWKHYQLDKSNLLSYTPRIQINGIQTVVNIVDGYSEYVKEFGWIINEDGTQRDFDNPSKPTSWQSELERFISYMFSVRDTRRKTPQNYMVSVDSQTNIFTLSQLPAYPAFVTGDPIKILSQTGGYPAPLINDVVYYIISVSDNQFRLAESPNAASDGVSIDITGQQNSDVLYVYPLNNRSALSTFELNPFRHAIWIRPNRGIISDLNLSDSYFKDQTIYDQYGNRIGGNHLKIYRLDLETKITADESVPTVYQFSGATRYDDQHMSALHLYADLYEHILLFNSYTANGSLIYDTFLGSYLSKFDTSFSRSHKQTYRPVVGGYFLSDRHMLENIESSIDSLRSAYKPYGNNITRLSDNAKSTLGYDKDNDYLKTIMINDETRFTFWRGQIQQKGSLTSLAAFMNSRRYIDARVDEFWAVKLADFGTAREREFISVYVTQTDTFFNDSRFEFVTSYIPTQSNVGVTQISLSDSGRWYRQPTQVRNLLDNAGVLYFELFPKDRIILTDSVITFGNDRRYVRHNTKSDYVEITSKLYDDGHTSISQIVSGSANIDYYMCGTGAIKVYYNGLELVSGVDYIEPTGQVYSNTITFTSIQTGDIQVVYLNSKLLENVHYIIINSNIVKFLDISIIDGISNVIPELSIWPFGYDIKSISPIRLIDTETDAVVSTINYFDPARGVHCMNAGMHIVDYNSQINNAGYTTTDITTPQPIVWAKDRVGTTWLDISGLDYLQYYDSKIYDNFDTMFNLWGSQSEWSTINLNTWVESDVHPEKWNDLSKAQDGNISIDPSIRKSGLVNKTIFEMVDGDWVRVLTKFEHFDESIDKISQNTFKFNKIKPRTYNIVNITNNSIYVSGDLSSRLKVGNSLEITNTTNNNGGYIITGVEYSQPTTKIDIQQTLVDQSAVGEIRFYENVDIYLNGLLLETGVRVSWDGSFVIQKAIRECDRITAVYHMPSDQTMIDAEVNSGILKQSYEYSTVVSKDSFGADVMTYYFWVSDKTTKSKYGTSPRDALNRIVYGDDVKVVLSNIRKKEAVVYNNSTITLPVRATQVNIRGLVDLVTSDNRYVLNFPKSFEMRDYTDISKNLSSKTSHEEWKMIRRFQQTKIDKWLWDKVTEAMIGHKLNSTSTRVPNLNSELYDIEYGSDTRYGLNDGQTIANGAMAIKSISYDLTNPDNDFFPVNIESFLASNNFNNSDNIISAMSVIYDTFGTKHVNRMFFDIILDTLSYCRKFDGLMKTSMIALHGIKPFQVNGIFDD